MLFNSWEFVALVAVTFALYYLPALKRWQIHVLIASSFVFYAYHLPSLLALLLVSIFINATASFFIHNSDDQRLKRLYAVLGVVFNLSILGFFKYNKLIAGLVVSDLSKLDGLGAMIIALPLPIGVSFYTFEGITLVVDVFRSREKSHSYIRTRSYLDHLRNTCLFISFFPHLVSGPILKAHDFMPQILPKILKDVDWGRVFRYVVLGYFLKMVIADNLKDQTFWVAYPYFQGHSPIVLVLMIFGFVIQIYSDFAGYSFIAMGIAEIFGYRLPLNFNCPFISQSFTELWTRWHISLSTFLRDYLYISMGGNRRGEIRTYFNLIMTMTLGGLWHGATWNFGLWGLVHGIALAIERPFQKRRSPNAGESSWPVKAFKMSFITAYFCFAAMFFKIPEFSHLILYVKTIFLNWSVQTSKTISLSILMFSLPVFLYHMLYLFNRKYGESFYKKIEYVLFGGMLFLILVNKGDAGAFIYFQF